MNYLYYIIGSKHKVQFILSTVKHLEKCIVPLQIMRDKRCLVNSTFYNNNDYKDEDYTEIQVEQQFLLLRNKAQNVLKHASKLVTSKTICR